MPAGKYRDRITIRTESSKAGDPNPDFTGQPLAKDIPARVNDIGGQTTFRSQQVEERITTIVEIREVAGLKPEMRIEYEDRILNIEYFNRIRFGGGPVEFQIHCTELAIATK